MAPFMTPRTVGCPLLSNKVLWRLLPAPGRPAAPNPGALTNNVLSAALTPPEENLFII